MIAVLDSRPSGNYAEKNLVFLQLLVTAWGNPSELQQRYQHRSSARSPALGDSRDRKYCLRPALFFFTIWALAVVKSA